VSRRHNIKELTMKARTGHLFLAAVVAVGLAAVPASAAKGEKKMKSHTMTGCLQKGDEANTYRLTSVEGKGPKTVELVGMASGADLASHVGHKVTITGSAVSKKAAAKAEGNSGTTGTAGMKKEEKGEHHMNVETVKMVAPSCP
jgi:FlaG/FlaF family flagellin (archaellin)